VLRRFTYSAPSGVPLEESLALAAAHEFGQVDFNADLPPNSFDCFGRRRAAGVRRLCERYGLRLGIHTLSAVNMAERNRIMCAAVDEYLAANLRLAAALDCGWIIAHGGYHFSSDAPARRQTAIDRMRRFAEQTGAAGAEVWFENHNKEPDVAEIHYMPRDAEELRAFFEAIPAEEHPHFRWAFNVAHANLVPEGVDGFLDAFGVARIAQVRVNDNRGEFEEHLTPGEGNIDFEAIFTRVEGLGYRGPYSLDFGGVRERLAFRERIAPLLRGESAS